MFDKHFKIVDSEWRGLGIIPKSGLEVNTNPILFAQFDTPIKIKDYVQAVGRTFEVLSVNYPADLFGNINHQEVELLEIPDSNNT